MENLEIKNTLIAIRESRGYSKRAVSEMTGIPYTTYIKYESGERKDVSMQALCKLADLYGVTTDYLLGRENAGAPDPIDALARQFGLNAQTKAVLAAYLYMEDKERSELLALVRRFAAAAGEQDKKDAARELHRILQYDKLHVNKASAGGGYDLADRDQWKSVRIFDCPEAYEADFAVEVDGHSMEPTYYDGDIVFIKLEREIPVGEVGLFVQNGKGYIKEVGKDHLISHNADYPNVYPADGEISCIGRVIGVARAPEV